MKIKYKITEKFNSAESDRKSNYLNKLVKIISVDIKRSSERTRKVESNFDGQYCCSLLPPEQGRP